MEIRRKLREYGDILLSVTRILLYIVLILFFSSILYFICFAIIQINDKVNIEYNTYYIERIRNIEND